MTAPLPTSALTALSNASNSDFQTRSEACDNCSHFKFMAYTITYSIVFPLGLLSNLVALFVFLRHTPKKSANTVFMTNLAVSDISFTLTLPFRLIYYSRECHWDFPDWLCRWCVYSFYVNLYTSVLFLMGLSVLRYIAVVHPIRNKTLVTVRRASLACFCIWVFVAAMSIPFLMSGTLLDGEKVRCFDPGSQKNWIRILHLNYLALVMGFLIPFSTILVCYGCIIHKLFAGRKFRNHKRGHRLRSVYLIAIIMSTFLLCFVPYHVVRTAHLHAIVSRNNCRLEDELLRIPVLTLCMAASNSCLNPLMYYFAGESFRTSFRRASRRGTISSENSLRLSFQGRNRSSRRGMHQTPNSLLEPEKKPDVQ
ncbi:cysteinyl leukotriene receptor 2 [Salminus brasiliensis]|uniref:cysteinyl leukotriene receptor 2 n=1 Tax=Salminus brasiliensis TaxID=930266 RepID=UPI003B8306DE